MILTVVFYPQVLHPSVGSEPSRNLGEQRHIRLLHRLHHGASYALSGSDASYPYAGKAGHQTSF